MKRFRFTLQALLTVRQRQERLALEQYADALLQRRKAGEGLAAIEDEMTRDSLALKGHLNGVSFAGDLAQRQEHLQSLDARRTQALANLADADRALAPALEAMLEARRQREAAEKCGERQRQTHQRETAKEEAKLLDELALRRPILAQAARGQE